MTLGDRFDVVIEAARRGEEQAITALYLDANPALLRYLRAREPQEADDLCSETWLRVARWLPEFEGDERRWLGFVFLVARRCLNDHWKRQRRRRTDPVSSDAFEPRAGTIDVEAAGIQSLLDRDAVALVTGALSAEQADVILLRIVAGLGVNEVAAAIGKRPGAVRTIQHRALKRLANQLTESPMGAPTVETRLT